MDGYILLRFKDPSVAHHKPGHHAHLFIRGPASPRQHQRISGAQESAPPRAPHLVRRHFPGGKRRLDSFGTDVQGFVIESPWSLDGVAVAVLRVDDDLPGLITPAAI